MCAKNVDIHNLKVKVHPPIEENGKILDNTTQSSKVEC